MDSRAGGVWGLVSDGRGIGMEGRSEGRIEDGRFTRTLIEGTGIVSKGDIQGGPYRSHRPVAPFGARRAVLRVYAHGRYWNGMQLSITSTT